MKLFTLWLIALIIPVSLFSAPKFPFPHDATYPYGTKPSKINNAKVQEAFNDFMDRFYEESGNLARIKFDSPDHTVSEGIGYGMLIMVYMDNATNNTKDKFDKLWNYYNSYLNENKLMHWKINGFSGPAEFNAATDAEVDVAVALMQAYKQWGDEKYLNDAKDLIQKIWNFEVNLNGYLKPGDKWDSKKNPSYFSTAALELFKKVNSEDWGKVIANSYSLINKSSNATTGLMPDWCTEEGSPLGDFYYDAARTPWRIAWGHAWFGHSNAKTICSKIASWINTKTGGDPNNIVDGYALNGSNMSSYLNSVFLGALACAGMVDAAHQSWLDTAYLKQEELVEKEESYFCTSLKVIYLLFLSGNMPNLWESQTINKFNLTVSANSSSAGSVSVSPEGTQFNSGTQITLTANPNNNFKFVSWSGDLSGNEQTKTFTINKDMNVTANFEPIEQQFNLTINLNSSSAGSVSVSPQGTQFNSGTQITLTANPNNNFKFVSWSGDLSGNEQSKTFTIDKDMNITANFESSVGTKDIAKTYNTLSISPVSFYEKNIISYTIPKAGMVKINLFNAAGKKVSTVVNCFHHVGTFRTNIKEHLSNGIYMLELESVSGKIVHSLSIYR